MAFWKRLRERPWPQAGLVLIGAAALLAGVWRQEAATVLTKAIHICLECIGIG